MGTGALENHLYQHCPISEWPATCHMSCKLHVLFPTSLQQHATWTGQYGSPAFPPLCHVTFCCILCHTTIPMPLMSPGPPKPPPLGFLGAVGLTAPPPRTGTERRRKQEEKGKPRDSGNSIRRTMYQEPGGRSSNPWGPHAVCKQP